jgi:hypothetical protein
MIFIPDTSSINYLILTDANDSGRVIYQPPIPARHRSTDETFPVLVLGHTHLDRGTRMSTANPVGMTCL